MNPTPPWEEAFDKAFIVEPSSTTQSGGQLICDPNFAKDFIRKTLLAQREEMKKGLEVIREKYITSSSCQNALGEAIAVVERVDNPA